MAPFDHQANYSYLKSLALNLNQALATYEQHLAWNGNANLDVEDVAGSRPEDANKTMAEARWACLNTVDLLRAALSSPVDAMYHTWTSTAEFAALGIVVRFGVVDQLYSLAEAEGMDGLMAGVPIEVLSERVGINPQKLARLMRLLSVRHWFREPVEGSFRPTRFGAALRKGEPVAAYIAAHAPTVFASLHELPDTLTNSDSRDSDSEHQTAFARGPGAGKGYWEYLAEHPQVKDDFGLSMRASGEIQLNASLREFPWEERLQGKTLVDVGGGAGHFSVHFAKMDIPGLKVVVQDLPGTYQLARKHFEETVPEFVNAGRAEFEKGDFFQPNTRSGENVTYLLRSILHDWSDDHCVKILSNLAKNLHRDSCVFVHDALIRPCLPPNPATRQSLTSSQNGAYSFADKRSRSTSSDEALSPTTVPSHMLRRDSLMTPPMSDAGHADGEMPRDADGTPTESHEPRFEAPWPLPRNFGPNSAQVSGLDALMLVELNGRERTESQIRHIAQLAGLNLVQTTMLTSGRGIFELRLP
ncbi:hypothetical protein OC846_002532 [Tilletia horrida]|uniref:O-methyltransferase C-terminal domain-containing protein n=1 Tax=Tilletia horrida TaxID=155126 RepID=A0AAN6GRP8_9BASI|nr:hypothetical protein OC846_002532 [Tilletia horrida]KAK0554106.1 hypothetical protein OC845_000920 [Tilletia horrida]